MSVSQCHTAGRRRAVSDWPRSMLPGARRAQMRVPGRMGPAALAPDTRTGGAENTAPPGAPPGPGRAAEMTRGPAASQPVSEILDGFLFLSDMHAARSLETLRHHGITHVVNATAGAVRNRWGPVHAPVCGVHVSVCLCLCLSVCLPAWVCVCLSVCVWAPQHATPLHATPPAVSAPASWPVASPRVNLVAPRGAN